MPRAILKPTTPANPALPPQWLHWLLPAVLPGASQSWTPRRSYPEPPKQPKVLAKAKARATSKCVMRSLKRRTDDGIEHAFHFGFGGWGVIEGEDASLPYFPCKWPELDANLALQQWAKAMVEARL